MFDYILMFMQECIKIDWKTPENNKTSENNKTTKYCLFLKHYNIKSLFYDQGLVYISMHFVKISM